MSDNQQTQPSGAGVPGADDLSGLSEDGLRQRIEEQIRKQSVADVLVQFMASLSNLAYMKMGLTEDTKDIIDAEQARLAIDSFKALLDAAGERLEQQDKNALAGALASMQLTFVKQFPAQEKKPAAGKEEAEQSPQPEAEPPQAENAPAAEKKEKQ